MSETPRNEQPEKNNPSLFGNNDIWEILKERKAQAETFLESLEGQPFEQETFSAEDVEKIIAIRKELERLIEKNKNAPFQGLKKIEDYLNNLDIWLVRFSTGTVGKSEKTDSLYYVAPNGASLRLKRSNLNKGLESVVQPFMETIFFEDEKGNTTDVLNPGYTTMEYCSREFYDLQNQNEAEGGFESEVRRYYKDGELFYVMPPPNIFHKHNGSEINNVFYISPEAQNQK